MLDHGERIASAAADWGTTVDVDWLALLGERAAIDGLTNRGRTSCGGGTRLLRCADTWVAVSLARPSDTELLPAWLTLAGATSASRHVPVPAAADGSRWRAHESTWDWMSALIASLPGTELAAAAEVVGLPVGVLHERRPTADRGVRVDAVGCASGAAGPPATVVDLSTLWAGPLCAALLGACGADVIKVSTTGRPDGTVLADPAWNALLNGGKRTVEVDLETVRGRAMLADLISSADLVVESARPRGLEQLGIVARDVLAGPGGPRVWVSITGHGRGSNRVAFGDDAAVAGGLVVTDADGPWFCGDAIADPLSGVAAAAHAVACLRAGRRALLDVALAGVAAAHAGATLPASGATNAPPRARCGRRSDAGSRR